MTTKIIFDVDRSLKAAAIKKAKRIGLSLSTVLNEGTRAFVDEELQIGIFDPALHDDVARARDDIEHGLITSHDDLVKELIQQD